MAGEKNRRSASAERAYGNVAYDLDYYGDVVAVPAPEEEPEPRSVPRAPARPAEPEPDAKPQSIPRAPQRVRVQVRPRQAVAPVAIVAFLVAVGIAVALLFGYIRLNSVYAETVRLQGELTVLQRESADLEALYEETFDTDTLERAAAGNLARPTDDQIVYIDLSEPDNAVVYADETPGIWESICGFFSSVAEWFR